MTNKIFAKRLWLIGGTQESKQLAAAIAIAGYPCLVTATTAAARSLYPLCPHLAIKIGRLSAESISEFLSNESIAAIVDASHPYAAQISQGAIAAAAAQQIPYLRYERPEVADSNASIIRLDSFAALFAGNYLLGQRVLLTTGYQSLALFSSWQDKATLFARILPAIASLEAAIAAGFTPERIIALRPPVPAAVEKALWQHWQISLVITKASGTAGGEDIKRQVATELGIPLAVITRPQVNYPQQTSDFNAVLEFCRQYL